MSNAKIYTDGKWVALAGHQVNSGGVMTVLKPTDKIFSGKAGYEIGSSYHAIEWKTDGVITKRQFLSVGWRDDAIRGNVSVYVKSDGVCSGTISSGGQVHILSGGTHAGDVANGGSLYVSSGGRCIIGPGGGDAYVLSGGIFTGNIYHLNGFGMVQISSGAVFSGKFTTGALVVHNGGIMDVPEAVVSGTTDHVTTNSGITDHFTSSGVTSKIILSGASCVAESSGYVYGTVLAGGRFTAVNGGKATLSVQKDATVFISSGGTMTEADWTNFHQIFRIYGTAVICGGYTYSGWIQSGGIVHVSSGGRTNFLSIIDGGTLYVHNAGNAENTYMTKGNVIVSSGGATQVRSQYGGMVTIESGGTGWVNLIAYGGSMLVKTGGLYFSGYAITPKYSVASSDTLITESSIISGQ